MPPSLPLSDHLTQPICEATIQLIQNIQCVNPRTLQFLVSRQEFYFIQLNPPLQLQHTITHIITPLHILKTQILLPHPQNLFHQQITIPTQPHIKTLPYPIQSPITTQHPTNHFIPHTPPIIP
ncbi:ATP-binding protein, partial [Staphylococcus saprophyticus]